jgi:hypothetical protein
MKSRLELPRSVPTLAERLSEMGYSCLSPSANGFLGTELGVSRGFSDAAWGTWWEKFLRSPGRTEPWNCTWEKVTPDPRQTPEVTPGVGSPTAQVARLGHRQVEGKDPPRMGPVMNLINREIRRRRPVPGPSGDEGIPLGVSHRTLQDLALGDAEVEGGGPAHEGGPTVHQASILRPPRPREPLGRGVATPPPSTGAISVRHEGSGGLPLHGVGRFLGPMGYNCSSPDRPGATQRFFSSSKDADPCPIRGQCGSVRGFSSRSSLCSA